MRLLRCARNDSIDAYNSTSFLIRFRATVRGEKTARVLRTSSIISRSNSEISNSSLYSSAEAIICPRGVHKIRSAVEAAQVPGFSPPLPGLMQPIKIAVGPPREPAAPVSRGTARGPPRWPRDYTLFSAPVEGLARRASVGEVPVVADVHAHFGVTSSENTG